MNPGILLFADGTFKTWRVNFYEQLHIIHACANGHYLGCNASCVLLATKPSNITCNFDIQFVIDVQL